MTIRKTYDLPAPVYTRGTEVIAWFAGNSIKNNGDTGNAAVVTYNRSRATISFQSYDNNILIADYNEARRVALAMLAAVEEAEANQNND